MGIEIRTSPEVTRRGFFQKLALATGALYIGCNQSPLEIFHIDPSDFLSSQLGININIKNIEWLRYTGRIKMTAREMVRVFLDSPARTFRLHMPFKMAYTDDETFDFDPIEPIAQDIVAAGGELAMQGGMKTFGFDELTLPVSFFQRFPNLTYPGQIDEDEKLRDIALTYVEKGCDFIASFPNQAIRSVHWENEGLSRYLPHTKCRYISPDFYKQVLGLSREKLPDIPHLQQIPGDNIQIQKWRSIFADLATLPEVISTSDILGINVYNQEGKEVPWKALQLTIGFIKLLLKDVDIVEFQAYPWTDDRFDAVYDFQYEKFIRDLLKVTSFNPGRIYLWSIENWFVDLKPLQVIQQLEDIYRITGNRFIGQEEFLNRNQIPPHLDNVPSATSPNNIRCESL